MLIVQTFWPTLPAPRALVPNVATNDRAHTPSSTPDSDSDGSVRPHPNSSSFRPSPTVVHGPRELLQEFTMLSATHIMNHPRRGRKVKWMRWSGARKIRMPGPPTRLSLAPSRSREHSQSWTIHWQHQGYQRILSRYESFSTHHAPDQPLVEVHNPDIIRVEEMFTYAPPISDGDRPAFLQLPLVLYGGTRPTHLGDFSSPPSEWPRTERAVSRSPRRCGYFGRR